MLGLATTIGPLLTEPALCTYALCLCLVTSLDGICAYALRLCLGLARSWLSRVWRIAFTK